MRTEIINIYQYSELSEKAKQKAREWWRECANSDGDFADCVYEDAANMADIFGLDINTRRGDSGNYSPNIYYSGFFSQGDGACFEGIYKYKAGALKAIKVEAPQDTELHRIVKALQDAQKKVFYRATARTKHRGHYYHSGCMDVDVDLVNDLKKFSELEHEITQAMRDFADWIYKQLKSAYDWENADEQVVESIEANEYEFLESGARARA